MSRYLGIDYGGTDTKLLLAERTETGWRTVVQDTIPTVADVDGFITLVRDLRRSIGDVELDGFGMTVAGILDATDHRVLASVNLPWLEGRDPAGELGRLLSAPGVAVNDGVAAATAEAVLGAGRDYADIFVVALGTGIAGAHVVNGVARSGAHGAAGELGHIGPGVGMRCSCGQRGCLETQIGGAHLAARWREATGDAGMSARELLIAADAGDTRALRIVDHATDALAQSLLSVLALLDPAAVVLGGGLMRSPTHLLAPTARKLGERATFHRVPPVVPAAVGVSAGAWGAVLAAAEHGRTVPAHV